MPVAGWLLLLALLLPAQDWPAFRGNNLAGVADPALRLPDKFDASTLRWSVPVPLGRSSPIVIGDAVVVTATEGEDLLVLCFNAGTGKPRWRYRRTRARRGEIDGKRNDPASATPVADGSGVYAFFGDFGLLALELRNGALRWELPLGPFVNNYGLGTSPILTGETVLLQVEQTRGSYLLAVHRRTGKVRWKTERPATIEGWSSPLLTPRGEVVTLSSNGLEAFSVETGKANWLVPAPNAIMIPVPMMHGGSRIIATMRGTATAGGWPDWPKLLSKLDTNADGKIDPEELVKMYTKESFGIADPNRDGFITEPEWNHLINRGVGEFGFTAIDLADRRVVWRQQRGLPYVPSPVVYRNVLYSVRNGGFLIAFDADTGALLKEGRLPDAGGEYFASLVAGDGKLYSASAEGKFTVIRADGANWEVMGSYELGEPVFSTPALAGAGMFMRTKDRLLAYRVTRANTPNAPAR
ncbi:MAG: PQQ-binding-like beta-propeller repeat protein [Bryobacterales bacterium]|nr:PQQ-binding-like beta-propeller repeat protein [Bryobacterales bacterium]